MARHGRPLARGDWMIVALAIGAAGTVNGCGSHGTAPGASQVVAKVNGRELTVLQLNRAMMQRHESDTGAVTTEQALKGLIDEELLVQAAENAKLDRDPAVEMRIDAVEREILARAYAEGRVYPRGVIEDSELQKFYDDNPALFSARRVYHTVTFTTDQRQLPDALLGLLSQTHSVDALRSVLSQYGVHFEVAEMTRAAEAMPLASLPRLAAAHLGDVVAVAGEDGQAQLLLLSSIESVPVSFNQAKGWIVHFLRGKRDQAALQAYLQQLQSTAKIEYVGDSTSATLPNR